MKKLNAFLVSVLATAALNAAVIEQVIVRQQWPWSTDIKVEYKILGVDAAHPVDIAVKAYNGDVELPLPTSAITGDRYGITEDGVGTLVIDPVAAFGTAKVALANFKVKLTVSDSSENLDETLYRVYDLVGGGRTDITRKEILNGKYGSYETNYKAFGADFETSLDDVLVWTAVTNDLAYMTTNLVMRKIPATKQVWRLGGTGGLPQKYVQLTEDFFIGVFPLTVEQWRLIYNGGKMNPDLTESMALPKDEVNVVVTRASRTPSTNTEYSMVNNEPVYWPTNTYVHDVCAAYCMGKFRLKFKADFDLPSDAQWEVACRAGSTTDLYSGKSATKVNIEELGWVKTNSGNVRHRVGVKPPNAWGLYDLYGNVLEISPCLTSTWDSDQTSIGRGDTIDNPIVDPVGNIGKAQVSQRGGSFDLDFTYATSAYVLRWYSWYEYKTNMGCRVVVPADSATWKQ